MWASSSTGSSESALSSRSIISFIDTNFQHQYLPNFDDPQENSTADLERPSLGPNKPRSNLRKAFSSTSFSNSTTGKQVGGLLCDVPRIYSISTHVPTDDRQRKLSQVVQTLAKVYTVCGALDKEFGSASAYKGGRRKKNLLERIQE